MVTDCFRRVKRPGVMLRRCFAADRARYFQECRYGPAHRKWAAFLTLVLGGPNSYMGGRSVRTAASEDRSACGSERPRIGLRVSAGHR